MSTSSSAQTSLSTNDDEKRIEFSKILAKSMLDADVRQFIKDESAKQFDNDYDILFQLVKDQEIKPGVTFSKYLSSLARSEKEFYKLIESLPLLTILVPELKNFSTAKWNISDQIPQVAVVNSNHEEKKHTPIKSFDANGNTYSLAPNKEPDSPVVVVKENERLAYSKKGEPTLRVSNSKTFFSTSSHSFYFLDDNFNHELTSNKNNRMQGQGYFSQRVKDAYDLGAPSQRDYIYYNIFNPNDQGPLNSNYAEYLTGFAVNNESSLNSLDDDPTTDWSDGALEFQVDVLFFNGTSTLSKISKVFSIPRSSLLWNAGFEGQLGGYIFPTPIMIATWDMEKYGDTWKYVVNEIDPGTVTTTTHQNSSSFGMNFQYDVGLEKVVKVGIKFGASATYNYTNTIQTQVTTGSDFCGEAVVDFTHPVLTSKGKVFSFPYYTTNDLNTGTVTLTVVPRLIQ